MIFKIDSFKNAKIFKNVFPKDNNGRIIDSEFKKFMRVKSKNNKIIGEIEQIYDNKLLISYTDGSNTGWNSLNQFNQIELDIQEIEKLDNGLNSSWILL
jgi:hypothetical protein